MLWVDFPRSVRVGDAHIQYAPISIYVLNTQAFYRLLIVGIGSNAGAEKARFIGKIEFGSIWINARNDIEGAAIQSACNVRIASIAGGEVVQNIEAGRGGRHLCGMDIAVAPIVRFFGVGAGVEAGGRYKPHITPLVALPDRFQSQQMREGLYKCLQTLCKRGIGIVGVESNIAKLHIPNPYKVSGILFRHRTEKFLLPRIVDNLNRKTRRMSLVFPASLRLHAFVGRILFCVQIYVNTLRCRRAITW